MNNIIDHRLRGEGIRVQIDESMLHYRQKSHTGRLPHHNRWVFGTINTPSNYYVKVVLNRRLEILLPIIQQMVRDGSIVISYEWRDYSTISETLEHQTVNHRFIFVNPGTGAHTQNVESLCNRLKKSLKKLMGFSRGNLQTNLNK